MNIIQTENLTKAFGSIKAVNQLNLNVQKGEIYGLVGPDGAGKTTTMRLLTTIMEPTSGHAQVNGKDIVKQAEEIKEEIGYMSQRFGLYQDLTVTENLLFYADIYGLSKKEREEKMEALLAFSNLTPFRDRLAGQLSGGMKQKLGLSCALIHTPQILFLDEPTNGVDPISRHEFWRILHQLLQEGVTIFISTAYMDEAERCHHVGFLHEGSLLIHGTPDEIKNSLTDKVYQLLVEHPRTVAHLLQQRLGEDQVTLFGTRIHLLIRDHRVTLETIRGWLPDTKILDIQEIRPSLEDVFIALLSKEGASHD